MRRRIWRKLLKPFRKFFWIVVGCVDIKIFKREYIYYDCFGMIGLDGIFDSHEPIRVYRDRRYGRDRLSGFSLCGPWLSVSESVVDECVGGILEVIQHEIIHGLVEDICDEGGGECSFDNIAQFIISDEVLDWMVEFYGYDDREELLNSY